MSSLNAFCLLATALGTATVATAGLYLKFLSVRTVHLLLGAANTVSAAVHLWVTHNEMLALACSALAAASFWIWWNKGGGDDTKRRLRSALKKFVPARRTAPATP